MISTLEEAVERALAAESRVQELEAENEQLQQRVENAERSFKSAKTEIQRLLQEQEAANEMQ